ncbi:Tat pathway signal sequence domain protein [Streptomyces sp. NPDC001380]|uniref:Tat pathway signal sequence domain protein n=1 Tax=Streptomyces sp. NPDC001380 TaxID=3364566 RepID=UPI0036A7BE26
MSSRRQAGGRTGAVGPVEAGDTPDTVAAPERPPERLLPALGRYWSRAPRRTRLLLAALPAVLAAALVPAALARHREHTPPAPPPWPAQVSLVVYRGPGAAPDPAARAFSSRVEVSVSGGAPVTVTAVTQEYAGLALSASPAPPFEVRPGRPRAVELRTRVTDCGAAPRDLALPFINVTLRNTHAIQTESEILGARYAHDLSEALRLLCTPSAHRSRGVP